MPEARSSGEPGSSGRRKYRPSPNMETLARPEGPACPEVPGTSMVAGLLPNLSRGQTWIDQLKMEVMEHCRSKVDAGLESVKLVFILEP